MPASKLALALGLPGQFAALALKRRAAPAASGKLERILVLGYGANGDLVYFLPALRALRRGAPSARIVFVANEHVGSAELIPATGLVDEVWHYDERELGSTSARKALARRVREARFDALVASGAAPMRDFALAALEVPLRVGHCRAIEAPHAGWSAPRYALWRLRRGIISEEFERRLALNRQVWVGPDQEHVVSRNLKLVYELGIAPAPEDARPPEIPEPPSAKEFAEKALGPGPVIGVHLGAPQSQYAKLWPAKRWATVAKSAASKAGARVVLVGGPDEKAQAAEFAAAFGPGFIDLTGACGLLESFAVIRRCRLFLSNDTGPAKAAMAMGVPTATVWGPSDRPGWGVFWEKEKHLEIFHALPCAPCVRLGLRNEGAGIINFANCGHHACLAELSPEEVAERIERRYFRTAGS